MWPLTPPCGGLNCGVDFKGGSLIEFSTAPRPRRSSARIRDPLNDLGIGEVQVQGFTDRPQRHGALRNAGGRRRRRNAGARAGHDPSSSSGEDVRLRPRAKSSAPRCRASCSCWASSRCCAGIALMLLYIWFRFGFTFGAAAVIALAHDVILTFGLFADHADGIHAGGGRLDPHHHRLLDQRQDRRAGPRAREPAQVQEACR